MGTNNTSPKWWETADDHKFALDVLQLGLRRNILRFIGIRIRSKQDIEKNFGLSPFMVEFHLSMLEKALVIERLKNEFKITSVGVLYLEKVEAKCRSLKNNQTCENR